MQRRMPELMRNTEGMEEGEGCGHVQGLLFPGPSAQWSGLYCCFHLIQVFSPGEGLHMCVPVRCLSFHMGDVSHAYQSHGACSTGKKTS